MTADFPKNYLHQEIEPQIADSWEKSGAYQPKPARDTEHSQPFSILMPPPNANASLHAGHTMYVIQDILTRFKRMQGHPTSWFPGTDHAGFETQFVYEKHLKKEGKSRFQFDRETLYQNIDQFVRDNSGVIVSQMKRLGFGADWSNITYMLDDKVVNTVYNTFQKLEKDGLIYRDNYLVNYCPKCGTTFADLEVLHEETVSPLYYIRYKFADGEPRIVNGKEIPHLVVATVRPETIFADTAIAIHPSDPRASLAGDFVLNPLTFAPIPIILDEAVDPEFGTGCLKITPAHDPLDFQVGRKHQLPMPQTITPFGKITLDWWQPEKEPLTSRAEMLRVQFEAANAVQSREQVVKLLEAENSLEKINEKYTSPKTVCYKAGHPIEPLLYPNWFVRMQPLAELGKAAVESGETVIVPSRFKKQYFQWLNAIRDWPISRQIVWGIRLPVWYNAKQNPDIFVSFLDTKKERHNLLISEAMKQGFSLEDIQAGLQSLTAPMTAPYVISTTSPGHEFLQETDTFDTWFSSGQWPLTVLGYPDGENFKQFYPTDVLDTMWDILFFWVARMIMLGKYLTKSDQYPKGISPFKTVYLHSMVTDERGQKMSKSKGNVINPLDVVEKYGADALRIAVIAGAAPGNPIALSEAKVKGYRNFANKIWNIGRFVWLKETELGKIPDISEVKNQLTESDIAILDELKKLSVKTTKLLETFRFSDAALGLYDFIWNSFANTYLEENKNREDVSTYVAVTKEVLLQVITLLHPFMPFVTEAVWGRISKNNTLLMSSQWLNKN